MVVKIVLYREHASNLPEAVRNAETNLMDMIITPIANPLYYRDFDGLKQRHLAFTRPDLIMEPTNWMSRVICKISDYIDCDSDDVNVRRHSENVVKQEIAFAQHVVQTGNLLVRLKGPENINLARMLTRELTGRRQLGFCIRIWFS